MVVTEAVAAPILEVKNVSLKFGGIVVLNDVSMAVPPGAIVGVIGPNGAGKTSLLNCIGGVYPPQSGTVTFCGVDISNARPHQRARLGIGRTFQNMELIDDASVLTNVTVGRHIHLRTNILWDMLYLGRSKSEEAASRVLVDEIIRVLELDAVRDRPAGVLPAGQRKLVEIARSLTMEPRLLLLDEPSGGMNHDERSHVAQQIMRIKRELGVSQVLIEHDLRFVKDLCDYVYVLNFGEVLTEGPPEVALTHPGVVEVYGGGNLPSQT
jgi:branched-chain amino acid transport system ATP-binding protein